MLVKGAPGLNLTKHSISICENDSLSQFYIQVLLDFSLPGQYYDKCPYLYTGLQQQAKLDPPFTMNHNCSHAGLGSIKTGFYTEWFIKNFWQAQMTT